jgi:HEAT repeat protein
MAGFCPRTRRGVERPPEVAMPSPTDALAAIFDADRALRSQEKALLASPASEVSKLLAGAVAEARALSDRKEAIMRLERLADLCAQVEGPEMVDQLIAILDDDAPSVRVQAAEALVDVGFERYAEVARGIERALERGAQETALKELPWVLAEIAEPSARPLIARFLQHAEVEVVASAVEALSELGDPAAAKDLEPLRKDTRPVELDEEDGEITATLGDLVSETLAALAGEEPPS